MKKCYFKIITLLIAMLIFVAPVVSCSQNNTSNGTDSTAALGNETQETKASDASAHTEHEVGDAEADEKQSENTELVTSPDFEAAFEITSTSNGDSIGFDELFTPSTND